MTSAVFVSSEIMRDSKPRCVSPGGLWFVDFCCFYLKNYEGVETAL